MTEIEKNFVRTFDGPSGRAVLAYLRKITIERVLGPNVTDSELRWFAAQSALVHQIENLITRGNNPT